MFIIEVPVDASNQDSTILVSHPTGYGEVINPAHHGIANEMVPAVMKPKPRATGIIPNLP